MLPDFEGPEEVLGVFPLSLDDELAEERDLLAVLCQSHLSSLVLRCTLVSASRAIIDFISPLSLRYCSTVMITSPRLITACRSMPKFI